MKMVGGLFPSVVLLVAVCFLELDHTVEAQTNINAPPVIPKSATGSGNFVIGGSEAPRNKYPWMVHMQRKVGNSWRFRCGGSLLSETFIITANHCVSGISASNLRVILGDHNRRRYDLGQQIRYVSTVHNHSSVDLAILELSTSATFNSKVNKIFYVASEPAVGVDLTVAGWGRTQSSTPGSLAKKLQHLTIPVASDSICNTQLSHNVASTEFCAGENTASYTNVCHGDSGGPAMILIKAFGPNFYVLTGVVARGVGGCPEDANYAVFQSFRTHNNWIKNITGVGPFCFPGDAMVRLPLGCKKRMDQVTPGDDVLALTPEGSFVYSEVIMMMHADIHSVAEYITIQTEKDSVALRISEKHMMYVQKHGQKEPEFRFAEAVQVGDHVFVADEDQQKGHSLTKLAVANVSRSYHVGAFAPLTLEGTVVVDDVVASSYGYLESQRLCHLALWPVRLVHTWAPPLLSGDKSWTSGQVHWAPALLQSAASPLL